MSTTTMSAESDAYAARRWPIRVTALYVNGTTEFRDHAGDFDPMGFAQKLSENPDIVRVEVSTVFVNGEQVAPESPEGEQ